MKIQVVYRNYIPLNSPYMSFWNEPPRGVEFLIPRPRPLLAKAYGIYQRFGGNPFVRKLVNLGQRFIFADNKLQQPQDVDAYFYVGMIPAKSPGIPYFIDIEHVYALMNFVQPDASTRDRILSVLLDPLCLGIVPISQAAARSLFDFFGSDAERLRKKVHVVYPSLPSYADVYKGREDHSVIPEDPSKFNFLFCGKDALGKGILEILPAFVALHEKHPHTRLWVISKTPKSILEKYQGHAAIQFFEPAFSSEEVITRFFLPAQAFVMPTHSDTLGMVFMEALACGKPVIATRQFATPEIVDHGVNGLLLDHPPLFLDQPGLPRRRAGEGLLFDEELSNTIQQDLYRKMEMLIVDPGLYGKMAAAASREFKDGGRFSFGHRNKLLETLFRQAAR